MGTNHKIDENILIFDFMRSIIEHETLTLSGKKHPSLE